MNIHQTPGRKEHVRGLQTDENETAQADDTNHHDILRAHGAIQPPEGVFPNPRHSTKLTHDRCHAPIPPLPKKNIHHRGSYREGQQQ